MFVLLSVAMHAGLWSAARRATPSASAQRAEPAVLRLVAFAPTPPARVATPPPMVRAPASAEKPSRAKPPAAKRGTRPAAVAASRVSVPVRAATPDPAAWRNPVVLPEFDDSIDDEIGFASARREAPEAAQAALPTPLHVAPATGSARYRVHYGDPSEGNVVAVLEQRFEIDGRHYRLHSEGHATGVVSWFYRGTLMQESRGRVSSAGLQPERYRERRGERSEKEAVLDAAAERVRFASGAQAALPQGAQDRLSVFVQLGLLLRADPVRFAPGAVVELPVLSNSRVEATSFRVLGNETVAAGGIGVAALHLRRDPLDSEDPAIDLWLALEPRVLPLRVRITEASGRALDQVVVLDDER